MAWFDKKNLRKYAPFVIAGSVLVAYGWKFIKPGPPSLVTISAGSEGGAYFEYAKKYAVILEKNGIKAKVLASSGSLENINRLKFDDGEVDVAFIQSGLIDEEQKDGLISLGSLYYEPFWVFYRVAKWPIAIDHLPSLKGSSINIGAESTGTRKLALQLLNANDLNPAGYTSSGLPPKEAAAALMAGKIDALMLVSAADAPVIKELLLSPDVAPMNLSRADAFTRIIPALSKVVLPRGSVSLASDIPKKDLSLVASTANLVARDNLHPAISYLLIKSAQQLHGGPQLLSNAREFPSISKYQELEVPEDVDKLYKQGAPLLYKYLPFWLANLFYRLWVLAIPLSAALLTLSDAIPKIIGFRGNRQVMSIYEEARVLQADIFAAPEKSASAPFDDRLKNLYLRTGQIKLPNDFVKSIFDLRGHLDQVAQTIKQRFG